MNRKTLGMLAAVVLALAGLFAAFDLTGAGAAPSAVSMTIGRATCDASQFNPTHFALVPGQTVDCSVTGTGLAAGSYTVLVKSSAGGNLPVPGTVDANGTLTFSYTFDPALFSTSVCGTTADVSVEGGAIDGQKQLFFGFALETNASGECAVATTTTPTTTGETTTGETTTSETTTAETTTGSTTTTLPGTTTTLPGTTTTGPSVTLPGTTTTLPGTTTTLPGTTVTGPTTTVKGKTVKPPHKLKGPKPRPKPKAAKAKATTRPKAKKRVTFPFTL